MGYKRTDANQTEIVKLFRELGATVWITSECGHGAPDFVVGTRKANVLIECKDGAKPPSARKLTPDEQKFHEKWLGPIVIITNAEDVVSLMNKIR